MILLIIVSLLLLSYFRIDLSNLHISDLWNSDLNHSNITFLWDMAVNFWNNYFKVAVVDSLHLILSLIQ